MTTKAESQKRAVRAALAIKGRTQEWLAHRVGVSSAVMSRVLNGYDEPSEGVSDAIFAETGVRIAARSEAVSR